MQSRIQRRSSNLITLVGLFCLWQCSSSSAYPDMASLSRRPSGKKILGDHHLNLTDRRCEILRSVSMATLHKQESQVVKNSVH